MAESKLSLDTFVIGVGVTKEIRSERWFSQEIISAFWINFVGNTMVSNRT